MSYEEHEESDELEEPDELDERDVLHEVDRLDQPTVGAARRPGDIGHLARRWVESLSARPPKPTDEHWVRLHLTPHEASLWAMMPNPDKRHSVEVALRFLERRPQAPREEIAGALLHDIGKTVCGLGVWGRVVATIVGPRTRRFREYHEHEAIGARLAEQAGSDPHTIALIAADNGAPGLDELLDADDSC